MNLKDFSKIHFIGIGGIGMSALARFFVHEKKEVSGSDRSPSAITSKLIEEGVTFFEGQVAANITSDIDLIVYTEAMPHTQEEMVAAKALGVPMVNYFEALGMVANPYYLIAVAGSHGKTTTTAMITDMLEETGLDPTAIIGSLRSKTGSNFRPGKSKYAVVEACEYKRDFLHLKPEILVITNIEYEHVDYYKDLADVQSAFRSMAEAVPETGFIITDTTSKTIAPILEGLKATVVDYRQFFDINLSLRKPGMHNRLNAAAALAVASLLEVDAAEAKVSLENFAGTWRRFEYKGTFLAGENGAIPVFDDYGHHPTEIAATIAGAREMYPNRHLTLVFQSHTYTRTHELFADFVEALAKADMVYMLPIYAAREENTSGVSSEQLAEALIARGVKSEVFETHGGIVERVMATTPKGGVVLVMGAGDVTKVANLLTN
jgi:UDP-N-acetylmuramate--alanine ligase